MDIVRNCINIVGITPEDELPEKVNGQLIETSQAESLFIEENIKIKNIYQIIIDIEKMKSRIINSPMNKIVVLDFYKKFKIAYYDMDGNMGILELTSPYNVFFDLESSKIEIENIDIHIADAYFDLVNSRTLYNHILYIIDIQYLGNFRRKNKIISFREENKAKENMDEIIISKQSSSYVENNTEIDKDIVDEVEVDTVYELSEVVVSNDNKNNIDEEKKQPIEETKDESFDIEDEFL